MSDNNYSVKEILEAMENRVNQRFDTVIALQEKTNGRVRALEMWRSALVGAFGLMTLLGLPNILAVLTSSV